MNLEDSMKAYPKILLLCSMNQSTANGITIANLFKGWPTDRIALAEVNGCFENSKVPHIKNYYIFGATEVSFPWPFNHLRKLPEARIILPADFAKKSFSQEESTTASYPEKKQCINFKTTRLCRSLKHFFFKIQRKFLEKSGIGLVSRRYRVSPQYRQWVRDFQPDVVYCVAADLCKLEFFATLLDELKVKGCIHIFDDYLTTRHEGTFFPKYWGRRVDTAFRAVCSRSSLHLAIGDKMAEEYTQRYGHQFYGFHNPIDPSIWLAERGQIDDSESEQSSVIANGEEIIAKDNDSSSAISHPPSTNLVVPPPAIGHPPSNPPTTENKPTETPYPMSYIPSSESVFRFLYAGKINKDTVGPIKRFMEAVERLNKVGHRISFKIHSPYPFDEIKLILGEGAEKVYGGKLPYAELPAAYRDADGLLLPLDFTEATIRYIRLSMLTKASEYMISGTPIFCFAPKEIAVSEYLLEHDAAIYCGDPEQLEVAILDFIQNAAARQRVGKNAVARAQSHHMMGQVNKTLKIRLTKIACA